MVRRTFVLATALAFVAWIGNARADDVKPGTHDGKVVKVEGANLTMTGLDGKEKHTHAVPADAKITMDGREAKLTDLKEGNLIKVTAEKKGDKVVITKIEAKE